MKHNIRAVSYAGVRTLVFVSAVAIVGIGAVPAGFADVIFMGSVPGNDLSASATFHDLGAGELQITLANTYSGDTPDQSHVLTALFFSGVTGLTPVSAITGPGSVEWVATTSSSAGGMDVGANWQYIDGTGISSSGLGTFSSGNFPPSPGVTLDGSAWGLLSAGYAGSDLDGLDGRTYIQNSVVFTLSGFTGSLNDITGVSFQYGTSLTEPNVTATAVPEPDFFFGPLASLFWICRRRSRSGSFQGNRNA